MSEDYRMQNVKFVGSFIDWEKCPQDTLPQYTFVGRSNVGKSSLINMLTGRKNLAHTSKTPGKTQTINFFQIDDEWHLVDLPGYGYAKISRVMREKWQKMVFDYLENTSTLVCTFVLVDSRIPPQEIDINFMKQLGDKDIPFAIIYTKADKLKTKQLNENIKKIRDEVLKYWEEMPDEFISSSESGRGRGEILDFIYQLNDSL